MNEIGKGRWRIFTLPPEQSVWMMVYRVMYQLKNS
jgi:hypothetical protein